LKEEPGTWRAIAKPGCGQQDGLNPYVGMGQEISVVAGAG
jgi:hypothetical protein